MSSATGRDRPHGSTPSNENAPGPNRRRIHRQMVYKDKQFFVHPPHFSIVQPSRYQPINRKHVEAYHIRPSRRESWMLFDHRVTHEINENVLGRIAYALHDGEGACCSTIVLPVK